MLRIEAEGRGTLAPIASPLAAAKSIASAAVQAERAGFGWNADQRAAAQQLFTSRNRLTALQRSEEHTSELPSLMRTSYAVFCLKKKNNKLNEVAQLQQNSLIYTNLDK